MTIRSEIFKGKDRQAYWRVIDDSVPEGDPDRILAVGGQGFAYPVEAQTALEAAVTAIVMLEKQPPPPPPPPPPPVRHVLLGSEQQNPQHVPKPRPGFAAHDYVAWGETITGTAPFLNIKMQRSQTAPVLWKNIAAGGEDDALTDIATQLRQGPPRLVVLHHEPDQKDGVPADFRAAIEYAVPFLRRAGVGKCKLGIVLLGSQWRSNQADQWIPDVTLDFMGVDAYGSAQLLTPQDALGPFLSWTGPKAIFETSFRNGTESQQLQYVKALDALLRSDEAFLGCALWEGVNNTPNGTLDTRLGAQASAFLGQMVSDTGVYSTTLA